MRTILFTIGAIGVIGSPASSQLPPLPVPVQPYMAPLTCPTGGTGVRAIGRALGVPLPRAPRVPGPPTLEFGGTTSGTLVPGAPLTFGNRWASAGRTTFSHVIDGQPGPVQLTLETCSDAGGGETVAIYPATAAGYRMPRRPRVMFSIAVPRGNVRQATLVMPRPLPRQRLGRVNLAVVIENASGRFHEGSYRLTVSR